MSKPKYRCPSCEKLRDVSSFKSVARKRELHMCCQYCRKNSESRRFQMGKPGYDVALPGYVKMLEAEGFLACSENAHKVKALPHIPFGDLRTPDGFITGNATIYNPLG